MYMTYFAMVSRNDSRNGIAQCVTYASAKYYWPITRALRVFAGKPAQFFDLKNIFVISQSQCLLSIVHFRELFDSLVYGRPAYKAAERSVGMSFLVQSLKRFSLQRNLLQYCQFFTLSRYQ